MTVYVATAAIIKNMTVKKIFEPKIKTNKQICVEIAVYIGE